MKELMNVIMLWIGANSGLPAIERNPAIEYATPETIMEIRDFGSAIDEVVAIYVDETETIYLPDDWTGSTPADLSVLVHETVHHLQKSAGMTYACPQAREKLAFDVQERWLNMFGSDLQEAFGIDKMTLLLRTRCMF